MYKKYTFEETERQRKISQQKAGNVLHEKVMEYLDDRPGEDYSQVMRRMLDKHPELKKQYAGI